jgi:4-oxalocrotonate tautomerase
MPFGSVKVIEGVFSKEQKGQLIETITEAMIEVEGEGMRDLTWVVIEEVKAGDWAIGGRAISPTPKPKSP